MKLSEYVSIKNSDFFYVKSSFQNLDEIALFDVIMSKLTFLDQTIEGIEKRIKKMNPKLSADELTEQAIDLVEKTEQSIIENINSLDSEERKDFERTILKLLINSTWGLQNSVLRKTYFKNYTDKELMMDVDEDRLVGWEDLFNLSSINKMIVPTLKRILSESTLASKIAVPDINEFKALTNLKIEALNNYFSLVEMDSLLLDGVDNGKRMEALKKYASMALGEFKSALEKKNEELLLLNLNPIALDVMYLSSEMGDEDTIQAFVKPVTDMLISEKPVFAEELLSRIASIGYALDYSFYRFLPKGELLSRLIKTEEKEDSIYITVNKYVLARITNLSFQYINAEGMENENSNLVNFLENIDIDNKVFIENGLSINGNVSNITSTVMSVKQNYQHVYQVIYDNVHEKEFAKIKESLEKYGNEISFKHNNTQNESNVIFEVKNWAVAEAVKKAILKILKTPEADFVNVVDKTIDESLMYSDLENGKQNIKKSSGRVKKF